MEMSAVQKESDRSEFDHFAPEVWVVGDLLLDAVVRLDQSDLLAHAPDHQLPTVVDLLPGGAAMHAAIGALNAGFHPIHVMSAVGRLSAFERNPHSIASTLFEAALGNSVQLHLDVQETNMAIAVLIHVGDDSRLLFSRVSYELRLEHILSVLNPSSSASRSFLYMSGYVLFDPRRTSVAKDILRYSQELGLTTVVDVVPHRIYSRVSESEFREITEYAHILLSHARTLKRLFRTDSNGCDVIHDLRHPADVVVFDGEQYAIRAQGGPVITGDLPKKLGPRRGLQDQFAMLLLAKYFGGT